MTQQVIHCRAKMKSRDPEVDDPSFGFTFEATGSDANFTFDNTSPVAALLFILDGTTSYVQNTSSVITLGNALGTWLSAVCSRNAGDAQVITTDITAFLNGAAAGPPLRIDTTTLPVSSSSVGHPEGVSAGVSWRAPYGSTSEFAPGARPRARYRNRAYLGPLNRNTQDTDATGASRVGTTLQGDISTYMGILSTNNTTIGTNAKQWDLVAWSRKDAMVRDAEFYAVSERFDYQRRRTERITNEDWLPIS